MCIQTQLPGQQFSAYRDPRPLYATEPSTPLRSTLDPSTRSTLDPSTLNPLRHPLRSTLDPLRPQSMPSGLEPLSQKLYALYV